MTNKGFTLIELMVVISIISLLSSVVLYSTSEAKLKADDAKMIAEAKEVEKAITLYKNDNNGRVPIGASYASSNKIGQMVQEGTDEYEESMDILVKNNYLSSIPKSPDGESYSYLASSEEDNASAVFAAALTFPPSNSSSNSCDAVETVPKTWGSCSKVTSESSSSADYSNIQYDESSQDFFVVNAGTIYSNCECNYTVYNTTSNNDDFPDSLCSNHFVVYYGNCALAAQSFLFGGYVCNYTGGDSVCSGSSDSDYCSCI